MTLKSEDMGKLVAGKSVLRYDEPEDVLDAGSLVTFEGMAPGNSGLILIDWIGDGTNSAGGWDPDSFTLIGTLTPDGWIEWSGGTNPMPGEIVQCRWRDRKYWLGGDMVSETWQWAHTGTGADIIAFRPAHREAQPGALCQHGHTDPMSLCTACEAGSMEAQPETDGGGEVEAIRQSVLDLCKGHPHAKIAWPHRELHDIADRLAALQPTPEGQTEGALRLAEIAAAIEFQSGDGISFRESGAVQLATDIRSVLAALASKGV